MVNFGVVKNHVSRNLSEHYVTAENQLAEEVYIDFINTVKQSPILMLEYIVFKNLEKGNLLKEDAMKYIDDNISLFKNYEKKQIVAENEKLKKFYVQVDNPFHENNKLMESIQALIVESASKAKIPNINKIHTSFSIIMESMTQKAENIETETNEDEKEFSLNEVIAVADKHLNEKLGELSEDEKEIVDTLYSDNEEAQEKLLESYKSKVLDLLSTQEKTEMINEVHNKVQAMTYNKTTVLDNILALYELIH